MKASYKSKTVLFNGLTILMCVATFFGFTPNQEIAEQATALLIALTPVINLILRTYTKEPISILGK